tara:strand:- start:1730 stop:1903 length:174 start_codon:yes stop_codon:yes gene_type:complete
LPKPILKSFVRRWIEVLIVEVENVYVLISAIRSPTVKGVPHEVSDKARTDASLTQIE